MGRPIPILQIRSLRQADVLTCSGSNPTQASRVTLQAHVPVPLLPVVLKLVGVHNSLPTRVKSPSRNSSVLHADRSLVGTTHLYSQHPRTSLNPDTHSPPSPPSRQLARPPQNCFLPRREQPDLEAQATCLTSPDLRQRQGFERGVVHGVRGTTNLRHQDQGPL